MTTERWVDWLRFLFFFSQPQHESYQRMEDREEHGGCNFKATYTSSRSEGVGYGGGLISIDI